MTVLFANRGDLIRKWRLLKERPPRAAMGWYSPVLAATAQAAIASRKRDNSAFFHPDDRAGSSSSLRSFATNCEGVRIVNFIGGHSEDIPVHGKSATGATKQPNVGGGWPEVFGDAIRTA